MSLHVPEYWSSGHEEFVWSSSSVILPVGHASHTDKETQEYVSTGYTTHTAPETYTCLNVPSTHSAHLTITEIVVGEARSPGD